MSHFSKIQTQIKNQEAAIAALKALGYTDVEVHKVPVGLNNAYSAARRQKMKAHIVVRSVDHHYTGNTGTDFGLLRQKDGTYEIVTDTFFSNARSLANRLPSEYAKQTILMTARLEGDEYTVEEVYENGVFAGFKIVIEKAPQLLAGQTMNTSRLTVGY